MIFGRNVSIFSCYFSGDMIEYTCIVKASLSIANRNDINSIISKESIHEDIFF